MTRCSPPPPNEPPSRGGRPTHFGVLCFPSTGPLNTMLPLAQERLRRGHRVTLFSLLDVRAKAEAAQVPFQALGQDAFPLGADHAFAQELGVLSAFAVLQRSLDYIARLARVLFQEGPTLLRATQVDALLVNGGSPEGGTLAEHLGIPFATVASAGIYNQEPDIPPFFTSWRYRPTFWGRARNVIANGVAAQLAAGRLFGTIDAQRQAWGLPPQRTVNERLSTWVQISQAPPDFEFPRRAAPPCLHFTGPFHTAASRRAVPFPFEQLDGRPLIYASMGTLQNRLAHVFPRIAAACAGLDAQLVISLGGALRADMLPPLPGRPLVVHEAPQLALLQRAHMMVTHAGMNSTMECLLHGVPMVAIPVGNDQPSVAARIAWTGAGELVPLRTIETQRLPQAIHRVFTGGSYREQAARLRGACQRAGGVTRAAEILEQAVATGGPVPVAPENRPRTPRHPPAEGSA